MPSHPFEAGWFWCKVVTSVEVSKMKHLSPLMGSSVHPQGKDGLGFI